MSDESTDRLVAVYTRYLGEPERELDVYAGFTLFFGGLFLGVVGLVVFAASQSASTGVFALRELAFSLGALGLPVLLVGVSVLLPVDRRATIASVAGLAVTLAAVAYFANVYPRQWNAGPGSKTLEGIVFYAVGIITVVAATAAALVSYHVERSRGVGAPEPTEQPDKEVDEETIAAQVERDVEEAMDGADISWGGVEKTEVSRQLSVNDATDDVDASGFEDGPVTERRDARDTVDEAVDGLQSLRGGEARTGRGDGTDEQAAALQELREKQREDKSEPSGLLGRVKRLLRVD